MLLGQMHYIYLRETEFGMSQDPFPAPGQVKSKERTSLTVGSVFVWGLGIPLKFFICNSIMV